MALFWPIKLSKNNFSGSNNPEKIGGAERDRTADPLLAKQALSQLSYSPMATCAGIYFPDTQHVIARRPI